MKLCFYDNLDGDDVPKHITHVIISKAVTKIGKRAFECCRHLVSVKVDNSDTLVSVAVMGDSVTSIEEGTFMNCHDLKVVQLSWTLH